VPGGFLGLQEGSCCAGVIQESFVVFLHILKV